MRGTAEFDAILRERRGTSSLRGSLLLLSIIALLLISGLWAAFTEIDDVTRADARIVPYSDVQVIQSADAGVLRAVLVRQGQLVEEGQILMELDPTYSVSDLEQQQTRAQTYAVRIARLTAEIDGSDFFATKAGASAAEDSVIRSETQLFEARRRELHSELMVLERQREQRLEEIEEKKIELASAVQTLSLVQDEIALMQPLVERRLEPETTLLTLRQRDVDWRSRQAAAESALRRLSASIEEINDRVMAVQTRFRSTALTELTLATAELAELQARLPALSERVSRAQLRSPVRGIVNQIKLTTLGGVVQPGEALIEIVPVDGSLLVEAYLRPSDIAFIYPGQAAIIKVTAYDFARYGGLAGEITRIGAGSVKRPDRDEEVFVVEITTDATLTDADGETLDIVPGMIAEVDILAGRKTILQYITQPIQKVRDRAFRE
jgi:membrane fusion protein, adhesin transport system